MPDPRRYRATSTSLSTPHPGQQLELRQGWAREFQAAAAAVLLCAGLMVLPALATLNFVVWLGCQDLDRTACLALLLQPSE
jgi:hypothetical protein